LEHVSCLTIDVREHNNDIVFLHKIIPGIANRSYGIAVAKMAGMPTKVVERAEQVLSNLENKSAPERIIVKEKPSIKPMVKEPDTKEQLSLFGK
jgi:DNA mismatch repair protein MutS